MYFSSFIPIYEDNIIKSCEYPCYPDEKDKCLFYSNNECLACDIWCKLINGKCILNYSFKAVYFSEKQNENIQLINKNYEKYIIAMIFNNKTISPSSSFSFPEIGNHTIYFLFEKNISSLKGLFNNNRNIYSISFTPDFKTENISDMSSMFYNCDNLISI